MYLISIFLNIIYYFYNKLCELKLTNNEFVDDPINNELNNKYTNDNSVNKRN